MSTLSKGTLFPHSLETEIFNKVKGHSSLAKLSAQDGLPFTGKDIFTFSFDSDVSVVGENDQKPVGDGSITPVSMVPIKVVYQSRVSNEYMYANDEYKMNILAAFAEGFAKKLAAGLDKMAMHGINPATGNTTSLITAYFDNKVTNTVTYAAGTADVNIDSAVAMVEAAEYTANGVAISPAMRGALATLRGSNGDRLYPEFAFGAIPGTLGAMTMDANATVSAGAVDHAIVGDFRDAFRWGIAKNLPLEIIEYGDPDGQGDLKRNNQIVIRSEAYIGWAILDPAAFARVTVA